MLDLSEWTKLVRKLNSTKLRNDAIRNYFSFFFSMTVFIQMYMLPKPK